MITILHGEHTVDSRKKLNTLREQAQKLGKEVLELEGKSVPYEELIQSLESLTLFGNSRLVIIDNFLSSLKPGTKRDEITQYFIQGAFDADLILWEDKAVGRSLIKLKKAGHVRVEEFKTPTAVFSLVESLAPNSTAQSIYYFHKTLESTVPEIVFAMLVRQFRLLIATAAGADIPEIARIAPWQKGKFTTQAALFSGALLKRLYKDLMIIDYQIKTGKSPYDLTKRIEQFMMSF